MSIALKMYEENVKKYGKELKEVVAENVGDPIEINTYFYWFAFDIMGYFAFSKSFGMLRNREWHSIVNMLRSGLAFVAPSTPVPWLVRIGFDIPIIRIVRDFQAMAKWCGKMMDERIKVNSTRNMIKSFG